MSTDTPEKLMLRIVHNNIPLNHTAVNTQYLLEELSDVLSFSGQIEHLGTVGRFSIYVFVFDNVTKCSEASHSDFGGVKFLSDNMTFPDMSLKRNVAWSFFSLNDNKKDDLQNYFIDLENLMLKKDFCYPQPDKENDQMSCLLQSIIKQYGDKNAKVEKVNATDITQHYCQFSGGGDICIHGVNLETLVVNGDIDHDELLDLSPIHSGTSTSTTLSIEGKRGDFAHKLKHQLWANMVIACIMKFINTIPHFNERSILEVDTITGYGMAYTGTGCIGFYKLNIKFGD